MTQLLSTNFDTLRHENFLQKMFTFPSLVENKTTTLNNCDFLPKHSFYKRLDISRMGYYIKVVPNINIRVLILGLYKKLGRQRERLEVYHLFSSIFQ